MNFVNVYTYQSSLISLLIFDLLIYNVVIFAKILTKNNAEFLYCANWLIYLVFS